LVDKVNNGIDKQYDYFFCFGERDMDEVALTASSLEFALTEVGFVSDVQSFFVKNVGDYAVQLNGVAVDEAAFVIVNDSCFAEAMILASGDSVEVQVQFVPPVSGLNEGILTVNTEVGEYMVDLEGEGFTSTVEATISLVAGWNLVSIPVELADMSADAIFPNATDIWKYQEGWSVPDSLEAGFGYWVKNDVEEDIVLDGEEIEMLEIDVVAGWNLIGSAYSAVVPQFADGDITDMWKYQEGWDVPETLEAGFGFWVKTDAAGTLVLDPTAKVAPAIQIFQPHLKPIQQNNPVVIPVGPVHRTTPESNDKPVVE